MKLPAQLATKSKKLIWITGVSGKCIVKCILHDMKHFVCLFRKRNFYNPEEKCWSFSPSLCRRKNNWCWRGEAGMYSNRVSFLLFLWRKEIVVSGLRAKFYDYSWTCIKCSPWKKKVKLSVKYTVYLIQTWLNQVTT